MRESSRARGLAGYRWWLWCLRPWEGVKATKKEGPHPGGEGPVGTWSMDKNISLAHYQLALAQGAAYLSGV